MYIPEGSTVHVECNVFYTHAGECTLPCHLFTMKGPLSSIR